MTTTSPSLPENASDEAQSPTPPHRPAPAQAAQGYAPGTWPALLFGILSLAIAGVVVGLIAINYARAAHATEAAEPGRYVASPIPKIGAALGLVGFLYWTIQLGKHLAL